MDALVVRDLTKTYRLGVGRARVREMMPWPVDRALRALFPAWWARDTFNALEDVSLEVASGTSVGMVGHNGAGKTTLLKVIAGVTAASSGTASISGRMAALIDVLVGFHPEMTGRENAYLLGAVHGFSRRSMAPRIDRVFEFAEIGEHADSPLKRYSAGMVARLGFSVIRALDVDVLLVDEVLAVGDAGFQRKCIEWLDEFRAGGGTLLFVSHNLALLRSMTERAIWMDHGKVVDDGPTAAILSRYAKAMERRDFREHVHREHEAVKLAHSRGLYRWGAGGARVDEVNIRGPAQEPAQLDVAITYDAPSLESGIFCIGFIDESGRDIGAAASPPLTLARARGGIRCSIHSLPFRPGIYFPVVAILSPDGLVQDRWRLDRAIVLEGDGKVAFMGDFGPVEIPAAWTESPPD
jgi:ABC-type polysaccharide/polyol phosphate transport system ATPase subunit